MDQFGRQYRLEIGNKTESLSFSDLRVYFSIQKTISASPNIAEIQIINLNQKHRNLISSKQYNKVNLFVGYGNDTRLIFTGDIIKVETIRSNLDFITKLNCADGYIAFTNSVVATTLSSGVTDNDVINTAIESMKIKKGEIKLPNERALPRGKVMMVDARELLNSVALNHDADWSIQDGLLMLLPKDMTIKDNEGFIISQQTGMIGTPSKNTNGIEIDVLLNPSLKIGQLIRLNSIIEANNGDYKITKLSHTGDSHNNTWKTRIVCEFGSFKK